jgi:amino acid transporter
MFEKIDKETREKFKKTEYGKKVTKMLFISSIVAVILFVISCIAFFSVGAGNRILSTTTDFLLNILFMITSIAIVLTCYFNGKKDGALGQFQKIKKK